MERTEALHPHRSSTSLIKPVDKTEWDMSQPTVNARWGNSLSVLLGDCLFAHALNLSTNFENTDISRAIALAARVSLIISRFASRLKR